MRGRSILGATLVAGLALTATACSSSASSTGSTGSTTGSTAQSQGSPIKLMVLGPLQSSTYSFPEIADGAKAALAPVNAAGGINGHKVDLVTCNDQANQNVAASCAREAVSDGVVAVVGNTPFGGAVDPVLAAAGIPFVGAGLVTAPDYDGANNNTFPVSGLSVTEFAATGVAMVKDGCKKIAIIANENTNGAGLGSLIQAGVTSTGGQVASDVVAPFGQSDYSSYVSKARDADCIGISEDAPDIIKIINSVRQGPYPNTKIFLQGTTFSLALLQSLKSAANGIIIASATEAPSTVASFKQEMQAENPKAALDSESINSWLGTELFVTVAQKLSDVTASSLTSALNSTSALQLNGTSTPLNFTKENPAKGYSRVFNTDALMYAFDASSNTLVPALGGNPIDVEPAFK